MLAFVGLLYVSHCLSVESFSTLFFSINLNRVFKLIIETSKLVCRLKITGRCWQHVVTGGKCQICRKVFHDLLISQFDVQQNFWFMEVGDWFTSCSGSFGAGEEREKVKDCKWHYNLSFYLAQGQAFRVEGFRCCSPTSSCVKSKTWTVLQCSHPHFTLELSLAYWKHSHIKQPRAPRHISTVKWLHVLTLLTVRKFSAFHPRQTDVYIH